MTETLRLTIITGPHQGESYCFRGAGEYLVGRASDCFVRMLGAERDRTISRHHCRLAVDPPLASVQDLGSVNGTYVNGHPAPATHWQRVGNGDVITVGGTSCLCEIVDCPPDLPRGHEPVWKEGEAARANCRVPCRAETCEPFRGCCAGGWSTPVTIG